MPIKSIFLTALIHFGFCLNIQAQSNLKINYQYENYKHQTDSLRKLFNHNIKPANDKLELATYLALAHYPELQGHTIKIKYKKKVQYPITASWSFGNIFKFRKRHTYILLLKPGSFVESQSLNRQIGVIGHEMAHFAYYKKRPGIAMAWWGIKYVVSKKFRFQFEQDADRVAIDHGLGWQLLDISFYLNSTEVKNYMRKSGMYGL